MMRAFSKYFFFLLLIFAGCSVASAQTHYRSNIYVGAHAGADFSRVSFTPSVSQSFQPGFNAGINFRYIEEKHFGFIIELDFDQRGWKEDFDDAPFSYSRTVNYLTLPFLAHIYFGRRGRFFINAGPSVSLLISESSKANFNVENVADIKDFPLRNTYEYTLEADQRFDYGISAGIGGEFSINPKNIIYIEGRFYYGLGNMLKSGRTEPCRGSNSMTISASIGYWFRVK